MRTRLFYSRTVGLNLFPPSDGVRLARDKVTTLTSCPAIFNRGEMNSSHKLSHDWHRGIDLIDLCITECQISSRVSFLYESLRKKKWRLSLTKVYIP